MQTAATSPIPPSRSVWRQGLQVLTLLALVFALYCAREVVGWALVALVLALALAPIVEAFERRGLRRGLAVLLVVACGVLLATLVSLAILPSLVEQGQSLYRAAPDLIERARRSEAIAWVEQRFGLETGDQQILDQAQRAVGPLFEFAKNFFAGILGAFSIVVLTIFMLLSGGEVFRSALEWVPYDRRANVEHLAMLIRARVGGYVVGIVFVALLGGALTTLTLFLFGVPYFLALGMAMAVLELVPFVGPISGWVLIVGMTWISAGPTTAAIIGGILIVYQQIENHVLHPLIQRRTIHMNPLVIVLVILLGTATAGLLGALLALPLAGAAQVVSSEMLERRKARWASRS